MVNKKKLLQIMKEKRYSQRKLAIDIGKSKNTINNKINGSCEFNADEIEIICSLLDINNPDKIVNIFLPKLSQNGTKVI